MTEPLTLLPTPIAVQSKPKPAQVDYPLPFYPPTAIVDRFQAKVVPTSSCWWWIGAIAAGTGYGCFAHYRSTVVGAHRWALEHALKRRLLDGEVAAHGCDEPLCVRVHPAHVHLASPEENVAQMVARGRRRGLGVNDVRGRDGRSRAIRDAVKAAHAVGSDVAAAAERAAAAGDPFRSQLRLAL